MTYYKARRDAFDYLSNNGVVEGELLTARERDSRVRYLMDDLFDVVEVSKKATFSCCGIRFACGRVRSIG